MQNPNITLFYDKSIVQKLFNFNVILSSWNTEETQILYFSYLLNVIPRNLFWKVRIFGM